MQWSRRESKLEEETKKVSIKAGQTSQKGSGQTHSHKVILQNPHGKIHTVVDISQIHPLKKICKKTNFSYKKDRRDKKWLND